MVSSVLQSQGGVFRALLPCCFAALVMLAGLFFANAAFAQGGHSGYTTTAVNMRTGPGTKYPVMTTIPAGAVVSISSCTQNGSWCDIRFRGASGWMSSKFLRYGGSGPNYSRTIPYVAPFVGIPFVARRYPVYPRYPRWQPYPHRGGPVYRGRPVRPRPYR
ncbi:Bacterial SH3 domain protein [Pseudovibrio axinellae]|uniref:Bacterial SH3 domain protein n=2 Tax=Pseudovibrio axinellae TaxID=989403 RepID=A0A165X3D6_9HYPH|nr:Bacterial SH3 domain protein [Pseudovibrio axinellae]SEQ19816.1 Uncharacterized conserved protein YraI [Pseudovibrio axinellae]